MKKIVFLITCSFFFISCFSQNVGIGTVTPNSNAALEIRSDTKGILMPRMSRNAKNAMVNVPKGMMVYDTTNAQFYYHDGGKWRPISDNNSDSLLTANSFLPITEIMGTNQSTFASNGILYDNGGPSGNYSSNSNDTYFINPANIDSIVGYKVEIEQMNLESPYDSLEMYVSSTNKTVIKGNTTGTWYFGGTFGLRFNFRSNSVNNLSGFKIRWHVLTVNNTVTETPPIFGWYFNTRKIAVRGGIQFDNDWDTENLGRLSFAYGHNSKATGAGSFAFGSSTSALAGSAVAMVGGEASGVNSLSIGGNSQASGERAIAIGYENIASADYAVALGRTNISSGEASTTLGKDNIASGFASAVLGGWQNTASGSYSAATGFGSSASNDAAFATGNGHASGKYSTAMGRTTYVSSYAATVIGAYNESIPSNPDLWVTGDPLFIIGNGAAYDETSNAMVILKNGRVGIGTNLPKTKLQIAGGTDASLADASGYFVIGDVNSTNLVFDNNEIIARNNGATSTLFLQNSGGAFEVGGTAAKPGGGSWSIASDARLKQNIKPYSEGLQQLLKINPVYFQYNQLSGYDTKQQYVGVLAQELKEVAPYMVGTFTKNNEEYLKVDNSAMTYMLINSVKELSKQNDELKTQNAEIKARLEKLEAAVLKK